MMWIDRRHPGPLAALMLLSACGTAPGPEAEAPVPPPRLPLESYAQRAEAGARIYRLDTDASRIEVVVRREGSLARFGHDHVIVVRDAEGLAAGEEQAAHADLRFLLHAMDVDPADARIRHGLDSEPDAEDIEGTRSNMLEGSLEASAWPYVRVEVSVASALADAREAVLDVTLRGRTERLVVPVRHSFEGEATTVRTRFELRQSRFGITPFSAFGGSLRVADALEVHARLVFLPVDGRTLAHDIPSARVLQGRPRSE